MNYKIINNPYALFNFIDWLPDLKKNETYYLCLFARSKYLGNMKLDKSQRKRFTSSKENMVSKIKALEIELGEYTYDGVSIPNDALVLYITPNPRDFELASKNLLKTLVDLIVKPYSGYNPSALALTEIQKSTTRRPFIDFDFDNHSEVGGDVFLSEKLKEIKMYMNDEAINIIKTRGGFHLLVETLKIEARFKKTWYREIVGMSDVDIRGDNLVPVPGCCQGGFTPLLLNSEQLKN
jgi:hypothetical protein